MSGVAGILLLLLIAWIGKGEITINQNLNTDEQQRIGVPDRSHRKVRNGANRKRGRK